MLTTGKNNRFPFLDILGYLKNTYKNPKFSWKSETGPNQGTWLGIPWLGLDSLCQIWDFYRYSLNTLKYPKMGIRYFFLCLLLWPLPSIHHFHIAYKMPCLPTKFCKRNWTQSLCKFWGVNKLYYGQMWKWWTFPTVPLPPPPHLKPTNLCLSDFREQNVWNMAILNYTVCMFLLSIYFKILNNNQYLKSLMSASTKCIAWDQAPQLGRRQKKICEASWAVVSPSPVRRCNPPNVIPWSCCFLIVF